MDGNKKLLVLMGHTLLYCGKQFDLCETELEYALLPPGSPPESPSLYKLLLRKNKQPVLKVVVTWNLFRSIQIVWRVCAFMNTDKSYRMTEGSLQYDNLRFTDTFKTNLLLYMNISKDGFDRSMQKYNVDVYNDSTFLKYAADQDAKNHSQPEALLLKSQYYMKPEITYIRAIGEITITVSFLDGSNVQFKLQKTKASIRTIKQEIQKLTGFSQQNLFLSYAQTNSQEDEDIPELDDNKILDDDTTLVASIDEDKNKVKYNYYYYPVNKIGVMDTIPKWMKNSFKQEFSGLWSGKIKFKEDNMATLKVEKSFFDNNKTFLLSQSNQMDVFFISALDSRSILESPPDLRFTIIGNIRQLNIFQLKKNLLKYIFDFIANMLTDRQRQDIDEYLDKALLYYRANTSFADGVEMNINEHYISIPYFNNPCLAYYLYIHGPIEAQIPITRNGEDSVTNQKVTLFYGPITHKKPAFEKKIGSNMSEYYEQIQCAGREAHRNIIDYLYVYLTNQVIRRSVRTQTLEIIFDISTEQNVTPNAIVGLGIIDATQYDQSQTANRIISKDSEVDNSTFESTDSTGTTHTGGGIKVTISNVASLKLIIVKEKKEKEEKEEKDKVKFVIEVVSISKTQQVANISHSTIELESDLDMTVAVFFANNVSTTLKISEARIYNEL